MLRRTIAGALSLTLTLAGCFIVTGSNDGYQPADPPGGCAGTADCSGGQVCCAALPSPVCQSAPCALAQLCKTTMECGDSAPGCALQSCTLDGGTFTLQACGALAACSLK